MRSRVILLLIALAVALPLALFAVRTVQSRAAHAEAAQALEAQNLAARTRAAQNRAAQARAARPSPRLPPPPSGVPREDSNAPTARYSFPTPPSAQEAAAPPQSRSAPPKKARQARKAPPTRPASAASTGKPRKPVAPPRAATKPRRASPPVARTVPARPRKTARQAPASSGRTRSQAGPAGLRASLGGASLVRLDASSPVRLVQETLGREKVALLIGGLPVTHHVHWRSSVGQFIRAAGGVAGVNGTFFKDAAIASNDSNMMGPLLTPDGVFLSESDPVLLGKISGRPLVAWSRGQFLVTSFVPRRMNHRADVKALLPGVTDAFVAGAWLVRGGQALRPAALLRYAASDAQQVRPRVFFGVTRGGQPIAGATITPVSSVRLAQIAQAAGAQEAVMLDGGYSTSLIYGARALAVGHSSRKTQSRPVPHAIVFMAPLLANAPLPRASLPRPAVSNVQLASKRLPAAQLADEQRSAAQRSTGQRSKRRLPAGPLASRATGETEDASTPR